MWFLLLSEFLEGGSSQTDSWCEDAGVLIVSANSVTAPNQTKGVQSLSVLPQNPELCGSNEIKSCDACENVILQQQEEAKEVAQRGKLTFGCCSDPVKFSLIVGCCFSTTRSCWWEFKLCNTR
jgi:hypothetical protein